MKIIGSGVIVNDIIVKYEYPEGFVAGRRNPHVEHTVLDEVGGTCGNVMSFMAWLGDETYPQVQLDESKEAHRLGENMASFGCNTRFVEYIPNGGTILLTCTHKLDKEGKHKISFRAVGPNTIFAKHKYLRERDEVPAFLSKLDFTPDVYFYDAPAAGLRALARGLKERGSMVYYEASNPWGKDDVMKANLKAMATADIVKFSGEHYTREQVTVRADQLVIRTLAADGLEYNLRGEGWRKLDPVPVDHVEDWEGAGDWTTSMFLHQLGLRGVYHVEEFTHEMVVECLMEAQKQASASVAYMGPHGIIHAQSK